jgi:hypothetical protein
MVWSINTFKNFTDLPRFCATGVARSRGFHGPGLHSSIGQACNPFIFQFIRVFFHLHAYNKYVIFTTWHGI